MKPLSNFYRGANIVKNYLTQVSNKPGVYFMYNKEKLILYIGKAKNLNKRLSSYSKSSNMSNIFCDLTICFISVLLF